MPYIKIRVTQEDFDFLKEMDEKPTTITKEVLHEYIEQKRTPTPLTPVFLKNVLELYPYFGKKFPYVDSKSLYKKYHLKFGLSWKKFMECLVKLLNSELIINSKGEWIITVAKGMYVSSNKIHLRVGSFKYIEFHSDNYEGELSWRLTKKVKIDFSKTSKRLKH